MVIFLRIILSFIFVLPSVYSCKVFLCNGSIYTLSASGYVYFGIQHNKHSTPTVNSDSHNIANYVVEPESCRILIDFSKVDISSIQYVGMMLQKLYVSKKSDKKNVLRDEMSFYFDFSTEPISSKGIYINLADILLDGTNDELEPIREDQIL